MKDSLFGITQLIDDSDEEEEATENPEGIFLLFWQNVFKLLPINFYAMYINISSVVEF